LTKSNFFHNFTPISAVKFFHHCLHQPVPPPGWVFRCVSLPSASACEPDTQASRPATHCCSGTEPAWRSSILFKRK
jgi:hypothetical protein